MVQRAQKIRLGIFLSITITLLVFAIIVVTGSTFLKKETIYFIRYRGNVSVTGLELGAQVKYRGIRIGRVEDIYIDPENIEDLIIKISVNDKVPIKEDTEAMMSLIGITGLKLIELRGGTNEALKLPPNSEIKSSLSLVESMSGKAEILAQKIEMILNNLIEMTAPSRQQKLFNFVDNASATLGSFQTLIDTNQANIYLTLKNIESFSGELDSFMHVSNEIITTINKTAQSKELDETLANLHQISVELEQARFSELVEELIVAVDQAKKTFTHIDLTLLTSRHDLLRSIEALKESMESLNEFARMISENPSLLIYGTKQEEIRER
ncbi:MCE family protein [candidate division KSB1 bacterium]|nr:MCE family protein [candidate division KSB1 bacterium]